VARTKLVAKLASRAAKPVASRHGPRPGPGVVVVLPSEELGFLHPLPVRALWGVGPATARRLSDLGVTTVGELAAVPEESLCRSLGAANGHLLAALARGHDTRGVEASREAKSVGHEETFASDLRRHGELHGHVVRMADAVGTRLREANLSGRTVTVKVRFGDFTTITRSHTLPSALDSPRALATLAGALLDAVDVSSGVRLLGVSVSGLVDAATPVWQLSFDDAAPEEPAAPGAAAEADPNGGGSQGSGGATDSEDRRLAWHEVEAAVSAIRSRYGHASIGPATLVGRDGLSVKRRGDTQWGPTDPHPHAT
jgi:DNA polymerase-4